MADPMREPTGFRSIMAEALRVTAHENEIVRAVSRARMVNHSPLVECWRCKQARPSVQAVNIAPDAAAAGPAVMRPICEECANAR